MWNIIWLYSILVFVSACQSIAVAADFWIDVRRKAPPQPWPLISPSDRLIMLAQTSVAVHVVGPIEKGDAKTLRDILRVRTPISRIRIKSPGGDVHEALEIADMVRDYFIQVEAPYQNSGLVDPGTCASACGLIWLLAPVRSGDVVGLHRPYFDRTYFSQLTDETALTTYKEGEAAVRQALSTYGYSTDFINRMFATPRQRLWWLTKNEILDLPIDIGLNELLSARCAIHTKVELDLERIRRDRQELAKRWSSIRGKAEHEIERKSIERRYREVSKEIDKQVGSLILLLLCTEEERWKMTERKLQRSLPEEARKAILATKGNADFSDLGGLLPEALQKFWLDGAVPE